MLQLWMIYCGTISTVISQNLHNTDQLVAETKLTRVRRQCTGFAGMLNPCKGPSHVTIYPFNVFTTEIGKQIDFFCNANSDGNKSFLWTKDNEVVSQNDKLSFDLIQPRHAGTYVCNVSNAYGSGIATLHLTVTPCGGSFTEEFGTLNFPAKLDNQSFCDYLITAEPGKTITLNLLKQSGLKKFGYTLKVYDGTSNTGNMLGNYQYLLDNWNCTSTGNYMYITYVRRILGTKDISASYFSNFKDSNQCQNKNKNACPQDCKADEFGSLMCKCWEGYIGDNGTNCRIDYENLDKHLKAAVMTIQLLGPYTWNDSLNNNQSAYYKQVESSCINAINDILKGDNGYRETKVISFRPGSIVVDFAIIITLSSVVVNFQQKIQQCVTSGRFGNMTVKNETISVQTGLGYINNVVIQPQYMVFEDSTENITCEASAISLTGQIKFEWKLNGATIKPTQTSRIRTFYHRTSNTNFISTLRIENIEEIDAGPLECTAVLGNQSRLNQSALIILYSLLVRSDNSSVENGSNAIVLCSVDPHNETALQSVKMCRNNDTISKHQLTYSNNSVLTNISLTTNTKVGCKWNHQKNCKKFVNIEVYNPNFTPCSQGDAKGITWNETYPGNTNDRPCPPDFTGEASRYCEFGENLKGQWKEPNLNCTRKAFADIAKQLTRIRDGVAVEELDNVLRKFTNVTKSLPRSNDTDSGRADIKSGVDILTTASIILSGRDESVTESERNEYFSATDSILDGDKEVWKDLNKKTGENQAAKIMNLVSNISDLVLKTLEKNKPVIIAHHNIVTQIKRVTIDQIKFPDEDTLKKTTYFGDHIVFHKQSILKNFNADETLDYTATYYRTISQLLETNKSTLVNEVGSKVIAFSIPNNQLPAKLNPPIELFFNIHQTNFANAECSYWNFTLPNGGNWATDGCKTVYINYTAVTCRCDHLTNFAVLLRMKEMSDTDHGVLSTISIVGCIISIVCLVLTLILYSIEWKNLTSNKAVILVILCVCLIFVYLTFLIGIEKTENKELCTAIAVLIHYLFLTVLFLMAAEGIIHAVLVIAVFPQRQSINKVLIPLAFGIPAVIVTISGIATRLNGYGTNKFCWLSQESGLIYAFFVPCAVVVSLNFTITGLVLKKLFSVRATMSKTKKEKLMIGIRSVAILAPVFGLTWVFGLLSFQEHATGFSYLFVIFNSFQGVAIFVLHGVLNKPARKSVEKRVSRYRKQQDYFTTKSTESTNARTTNVLKKFNSKAETSNYSSGEKSTVVMNPTYDLGTTSKD